MASTADWLLPPLPEKLIRKISGSPKLAPVARLIPRWVKKPIKMVLSRRDLSEPATPRPAMPGPLWNRHTNRLPLQTLVNQLSQADVVSFDVFDTLILRPFLDPKDIFSLVEVELDRPGFRVHRIRAEKEARADAMDESDGLSQEVSLRDIYAKFHSIDGIDIEQGMNVEIQNEVRYVRPNAYMVDALYAVIALGKRVVFTSDMYMSSEQIRLLLSAAGIQVDAPIFVSSEHGVSKRHGGLFDVVRGHFSNATDTLEYVHIGDNWIPDVEIPRTRGWKSIYYHNVHTRNPAPWTKQGETTRSHSVQGLIDVKFGNVDVRRGSEGLNYYALGYRYSGPMALAFAEWIARRATIMELDQVVFLARDGYLPHCVFQIVAPTIPSCYLPWSRAVGLTGAAKNFKGEWIRQFVNRAAEAGHDTVEKALTAVKIQFDDRLLSSYGLHRWSSLGEVPTTAGPNNAQSLQRLFEDHWSRVMIQLEQASDAVLEAVNSYVKGTKIGVVDLGWAGTGVLTLRSMLSGRDVRGFQFGAFRQQRFAAHIEDGVIETFAFGADKNFQYRNLHARNALVNNTLLEILMGAPHATVASISAKSGPVAITLGEQSAKENRATREIVMGALDFTTDYSKAFLETSLLRTMSGGSAAALYAQLESQKTVVRRLIRDFPSKLYAAPNYRGQRQ